MTYADKLKDPRWQRKRLEILQRDNFTCVNCKAKNKTLHVHHVVYLKDHEPWDYTQSLLTLCDECHVERQNAQNQLLIATSQMSCDQLMSLGSFVATMFDIEKHPE